MKIILSNYFLKKLARQLNYIALDSPSRARKFKKSILSQLEKFKNNPYKSRKSIFFNINSRRDLIYKGYVITYEIFDDRIEVIGLNKYQNEF